MRDLAIAIEVQTAQAEPALARVEQGLQGVEKAAGGADKSLSAIEQHAPELGAKLDELKQRTTNLSKELDKKKESAEKGSVAIGGLERAVRTYAAPAAIGLAIKQTLAWADGIENLSKQTGIAPGKLQALEFSAKQVGLTIDPVARSIGMMSDRIASGDKSAVGALERLGLSFKNIRGMSPDAAFITIAKAIAEVEDPMQRAADATDVFGRTGLELLPLLTSDIDALMKKAQQLGLVMDDETTKAAANLNNQLGNLLDVGKRLIMVFFAPLLPIVNALIGPIGFLTAELGKMINAVLSPLQQLREFAELLGVIQTRLPGLPKGPGATFMPGSLPIPGDPATSGVFGQSLEFTIAQMNAQMKARAGAGGGRSNVLPFQRPGYEPMDAGYLGWLQQARGVQSFGLPGIGPGTFPGWAQPTPFSGKMEGGLPWAPYAGTVGQNRPGMGGGFLSGAGGRFLGMGLGMASNFLPGMNQTGSMIGSSFGGAMSGIKGISGMLGSFAPFLGPIAGIAGGLLGKLFGPSEKDKAGDARNSFIGDFGGMGALTEAAGKAGFSLDGLMNAKKVADVEKEVRKLTEAVGAYDQKLADANAELVAMQDELAGVVAKGKDLGYNFDEAGNLVSVSFEKMQEKAKTYGLDLEALGPSFQQARLHESATNIINDFDLLTKGGASVGTVLSGMSDEISVLVQDSLKFGTEIPANMQPWIEELLRTQQLTDENGVAITDLTGIKFGAPIATEFEKITTTMLDLIAKIGEMVDKISNIGGAVDAATRPRTINIGFNVEEMPDIPDVETMSRGGFVPYPKYFAGGGFIPRGTDTVPAMLTPGEGVLRRDAVSRLMRGDWPSGGSSMNLSIENITVGEFRSESDAEAQIGRAMVRGLKRKGVRLNAA